MSTTPVTSLSPTEQAVFAAMAERVRQLRRRRGVPNEVSLDDAVTLHMISVSEVEQARRGDTLPSLRQVDTATS